MARRDLTLIGRLLQEIPEDLDFVSELYLRTLCRLPSQQELDTAFAYIDSVPRRQQAFEDLLWGTRQLGRVFTSSVIRPIPSHRS